MTTEDRTGNATRAIVVEPGEGRAMWFVNTGMTLKATAGTTGGAYGLLFFADLSRPAQGAGLPSAGSVDVGQLRRVGDRYGDEVVGPPLAPAGDG
jgi:hypothetical protein